MYKIQTKMQIGEKEITIMSVAQNDAEIIKRLSFLYDIPSKGPNGETDLKVSYRTTPVDGYEFYSILCPSAKMEFKFGQSKQTPGTLFPKGWEPMYEGGNTPAPAQGAPQATKPQTAAPQTAAPQTAAQTAPAANPQDVDAVLGEFL